MTQAGGVRVVGLGAGGHARVVIEILRAMGGFEIVGLLDSNAALHGSKILDVPVLGGDELLGRLRGQGVNRVFLGLGAMENANARRALFERAREMGFEVAAAIHPRSTVSATAAIGHGPTIMPGAIINAAARLGDNVIINTGAIVEHDCVVESHAHIATGARLAGSVHVGEGAMVGVGAAVRQCLRIGRHSVIGAGAAVVSDVPDGVVFAGVPARFLRDARK